MRIRDPRWKTFGSGINILNGFTSVGDSDTVLIKLILGFIQMQEAKKGPRIKIVVRSASCLNPAGPVSATLAYPVLRVRDPVLFVLF
jgi:hypothetical protein